MDGLVTEIHRLRSLKALLQVREAAQAAYSRAWVAQDKLHFTDKQFREKGRNDKVCGYRGSGRGLQFPFVSVPWNSPFSLSKPPPFFLTPTPPHPTPTG